MPQERKTRFLEMRRSRPRTSQFTTTITALLVLQCNPLRATSERRIHKSSVCYIIWS
jgi:hypothetical protein